jgi:hypothetical protein
MQLYIYARKSLQHSISNISSYAENTGFLHVFPNKGGICTSFTLDGTSLSFISTHLTAHEGVKKCILRNDSTKEILGGIRTGPMKDWDPSLSSHHTFWMGDMNYRITFDPNTPDTVGQSKIKHSAESAKELLKDEVMN